MPLRLLLAILLLSTACSDDGPSAPGRPPLPLTAGSYVLMISGDSFGCGDVRFPQSGTSALAVVNATQAGSDWLLRPRSPAGGEFELQLTAGPPHQIPGHLTVSGTIRGQMIDSYSFDPGFPPSGRRVSFQVVPVNGEMAGSEVSGNFGGQVVFNRDGIISVCPPGFVSFSLARLAS